MANKNADNQPFEKKLFVLSNGSLSSNTGGEGNIRKKIVEADLVDCIVMLPTQLFYNTGIPFEDKMTALTQELAQQMPEARPTDQGAACQSGI